MHTFADFGIDIHGKTFGEVKVFLRFTAKIQQTDTCWLWTGACFTNGYGAFSLRRQNVKAHRFAYQLVYGPISDEKLVLHRCDVRHCVNPSHLFLGTQADNMRDMVAKGRQKIVINREARCKPRHAYKTNTSGHVGVSWNKKLGKWTANLPHAGRQRHLGVFATFDEAVDARMRAERDAYMG